MSAEEGGGHGQEEAGGEAGAIPDPVYQTLLDELRRRLRRGDLASIRRAFAPLTIPPRHAAQQGAIAQEGGGAALDGASIGFGASAAAATAAAASAGGVAGGLFSVEQIHAAAARATAADSTIMSDVEPSSFPGAAAAAAASSTSPSAASVSRALSESSASPSSSPASPSSSTSSSEKSKAALLTQVLDSVPFVHLALHYSRESVLRPWLDELPTALLLDVAFHVGVYGDYELKELVGSREREVKTKNRCCLSMMDSDRKNHSMRSSLVASIELLRAIGVSIHQAPTKTLLSKLRDALEVQVGRFLLPATLLLDIVVRIKPGQKSKDSQKRAFQSVALLRQWLTAGGFSAEGDFYLLFERAMDNHLLINLQQLADALLSDGLDVPPVGANWTLQHFFVELLWANMLMRYNDMLTLERWMAKAGVPPQYLPFLAHDDEATRFEQQQQQQLAIAAAAAAAAAVAAAAPRAVWIAQTIGRAQPALVGASVEGPGPATRPLAARALPNCSPLPALLPSQPAHAAPVAVSVPANGDDPMHASEAPNVCSIGSLASPGPVGPAASPDFAVLNDDLADDNDEAVRRTFDSSSSSNTSDSELLERQAARAQSNLFHQL